MGECVEVLRVGPPSHAWSMGAECVMNCREGRSWVTSCGS